MEKNDIDELQKHYDETSAFKQSITNELVEMQYKTSACAKRLSRLNSQQALLEGSRESDEVVARKLDQLKTELDETENSYRELQSQADRLLKAEVDAINQVQTAENALQIERLSKQS